MSDPRLHETSIRHRTRDLLADDLDAGRGSTALIFGLTLFLFFGVGVVSGPLADRFGPRRLMLLGAVLLSAGLALTSRVDSVVEGYATYGLGVGLGGVPLAERLIDDNGWRSAYRTLAVIDLVLLTVAALVVLAPPSMPPPPALARMKEVAATLAFRRLFLTGLLFSVALFIAFGFIVDFATDEGITSSRASLLVGITGASSVVGRLALTALSSRVSSTRLLQACLAAQPVAFALWLVAGGTYPLLVSFAVLLGVAYGGFVALGPEVSAALFGVVGLGSVMGLQFLGAGLGGLFGPPLAGWLADAMDGRTAPIVLALTVSVAAFILSLGIPSEEVGTSAR